MKDSDRKQLESALAKLSQAEQRRLYKLAAIKRKAARLQTKNHRDRFVGQLDEKGRTREQTSFDKRRRHESWSLEDWVSFQAVLPAVTSTNFIMTLVIFDLLSKSLIIPTTTKQKQ